MTVKEIMERFKDRDPNEEIAVAYWVKEDVEAMQDCELTDDQWCEVSGLIEDREWCDVNDDIAEFTEELTGNG